MMSNRVHIARLVFTLFAFICWAEAATNVAVKEPGFETIYLDYPSWITSIEFDSQANRFYVFGGWMFRQIEHTTIFEAVDNYTLFQYDVPFIDVDFFSIPGSSERWAVGPTNAAGAGTIGYFSPLTVISSKVKHFYQGDHRGFTFSAVSVDSRNLSNTLAYWVGWGPSDGGSDAVDFLVARSFMNLANFSSITWNNVTDTVFLHQNDYYPFHPTFKPSIYHDWNTNYLFVLDPNLRLLYKIRCPPNGESPLLYEGRLDLSGYGQVSSTNFHWAADILYLGYAGAGVDNGSLIEIDLKSFAVSRKIYFHSNYSNPRAITGSDNTLYIGFEGGPAIVSIDIPTFKITGYAPLPEHLNSVYVGWDDEANFVYFATYEQKSKLFRVDKKNFCSTPCYGLGSFCEAGKCGCIEGWVLDRKKESCHPRTLDASIPLPKQTPLVVGKQF